jgi:glyoxylase-like metal-dependent hydrolase (beta-lactamase superfamily II)
MQVGDLGIDGVIDGAGRFPPTLTFKSSTPEQWAAHQDLLDADGLLGFSMGGFLIRDGTRTVLVDLGVGRRRIMGIQGGGFLTALAALGVTPADVTDVVFTHLHVDHVGWAADDEGQPVFPAATYRCAGADWDHFMTGHPGEVAELLAGVRDRFETWDGSGPILPGIDALAAPGHTPGSTVIVASSGSERAMMLGDVVHCPVQLVEDEWGALFDVDPALAARTRTALARELEGSGALIAAAHFPGLEFGRLLRASSGRRWLT